jgi:hypothetical protein
VRLVLPVRQAEVTPATPATAGEAPA